MTSAKRRVDLPHSDDWVSSGVKEACNNAVLERLMVSRAKHGGGLSDLLDVRMAYSETVSDICHELYHDAHANPKDVSIDGFHLRVCARLWRKYLRPVNIGEKCPLTDMAAVNRDSAPEYMVFYTIMLEEADDDDDIAQMTTDPVVSKSEAVPPTPSMPSVPAAAALTGPAPKGSDEIMLEEADDDDDIVQMTTDPVVSRSEAVSPTRSMPSVGDHPVNSAYPDSYRPSDTYDRSNQNAVVPVTGSHEASRSEASAKADSRPAGEMPPNIEAILHTMERGYKTPAIVTSVKVRQALWDKYRNPTLRRYGDCQPFELPVDDFEMCYRYCYGRNGRILNMSNAQLKRRGVHLVLSKGPISGPPTRSSYEGRRTSTSHCYRGRIPSYRARFNRLIISLTEEVDAKDANVRHFEALQSVYSVLKRWINDGVGVGQNPYDMATALRRAFGDTRHSEVKEVETMEDRKNGGKNDSIARRRRRRDSSTSSLFSRRNKRKRHQR